jgi:hypothetical protein
MKSLFLLALGLSASMAQAGPLLHWGSNYAFTGQGAPDVVDRMGFAVHTSSTFLAVVYRASDRTELFRGSSLFWSIAEMPGVGYEGLTANDAWNGTAVITRIYDAAETAQAQYAAETAPWTLTWAVSPPAPVVNYNFGRIAAGDWRALEKPWEDGATDLGGGWRRLDWWGAYVGVGGGWYWHAHHGYFYVATNSTPENMYLYTMDMGWLFTRRGLHPYLYRFRDQAWLWYQAGSVRPRWFLNLRTGRWERG